MESEESVKLGAAGDGANTGGVLPPALALSNIYVHPSAGWWGRLNNRILGCQLLAAIRRAVMLRLPFLKLISDVEDVVYLNWVVDLEPFAAAIPPGVVIASRDEKGVQRCILTMLTYRHRHFGPAFLGPLRRLFPSPLQSNWRLYVRQLPQVAQGADIPREQVSNGQTVEGVVLFLKNVLSSWLFAAGSRLTSDALPSHLAQIFAHDVTRADSVSAAQDLAAPGTRYVTRITSGIGSAPALASEVEAQQLPRDTPHDEPILPSAFTRWFGSWREAVAALSLQHSAVTPVEGIDRIAQAGITLPIDVSQVRPLVVHSAVVPWLEARGCRPSEAWAFVVPRVKFEVLWEKLL